MVNFGFALLVLTKWCKFRCFPWNLKFDSYIFLLVWSNLCIFCNRNLFIMWHEKLIFTSKMIYFCSIHIYENNFNIKSLIYFEFRFIRTSFKCKTMFVTLHLWSVFLCDFYSFLAILEISSPKPECKLPVKHS